MILDIQDEVESMSLPSEPRGRGRRSTKVYGYNLPRTTGPEMSALDAVNYINAQGHEVSRQWILKQAREKGPEGYDGILGWIHTPYTPDEPGGWYPRHMYEAGANERLAVWFDKSELDRWIEARKAAAESYNDNLKAIADIEIPDDVRAQIIEHASEAKDESGGVIRTKLRDILMRTYGYSERYIYKRIQKIAEQEQWPYPVAMPRRPRFKRTK